MYDRCAQFYKPHKVLKSNHFVLFMSSHQPGPFEHGSFWGFNVLVVLVVSCNENPFVNFSFFSPYCLSLCQGEIKDILIYDIFDQKTKHVYASNSTHVVYLNSNLQCTSR